MQGFSLYSRDAAQQALGFLVSQTSFIEPEVYKTQYPDIQYQDLIPVDSRANEWAKSVTFYSSDMVGRAEWFNHQASDVPLADVTRQKFEHGIEMAAIGYSYTLEELGHAMMIPGMNLTTDRAEAARRAYLEFVDYVALHGDTAKAWTGLFNDPNVTIVNAADGAGTPIAGSTKKAWDSKTGDEIAKDVNDALTGIYTGTSTVEMADTVLLPVAEVSRLATTRMNSTTDINVLEWISRYNTYTQQTKQPLTIRAVRGLENAGAGGDIGRMVVYRRSPQVLKMHIPMPHRFLPVWQRGPLVFDVPGIFRLGGLEIRRPKAVRYVDAISNYAS